MNARLLIQKALYEAHDGLHLTITVASHQIRMTAHNSFKRSGLAENEPNVNVDRFPFARLFLFETYFLAAQDRNNIRRSDARLDLARVARRLTRLPSSNNAGVLVIEILQLIRSIFLR